MNDAIWRGFYYEQLRHVFDLFSREQVLVLQFERCVADPVGGDGAAPGGSWASRRRDEPPERLMQHKQAGRKTPELAPVGQRRARRALPGGRAAARRALPGDRPLAVAERLGPEPARERGAVPQVGQPARRPMRLVMTLKVRDEEDVIEDNLRFHRAWAWTSSWSWTTAPWTGRRRSSPATRPPGWRTCCRRRERLTFEPWAPSGTRAWEGWRRRVRRRLGDSTTTPTSSGGRSRGDDQGGARGQSRSSSAPSSPRAPSSWAARTAPARSPSGWWCARRARACNRRSPTAPTRTWWCSTAAPTRSPRRRTGTSGGRCARRGARCIAAFAAREDGGARAIGAEDMRLVWAPTWPLRIFHFPLRSFEQFRRRTEISLRHGGFRDTGRFRRLRRHYEQGRLEELYAELIWDDAAVEEGIREGKLVRDERLAELLPRCPDPLAGAPAGVRARRARPASRARARAGRGGARRDAADDPHAAVHMLRWSSRGSESTSCTPRTSSCARSSAAPSAGAC